jgi:hypothetical protein
MEKVLSRLSMGGVYLALLATAATAETVEVKYRGPVDLAPFDCQDITRSSFVRRVCFDAAQSYMLIELGATYYQYCEIDRGTVDGLLSVVTQNEAQDWLRPPGR